MKVQRYWRERIKLNTKGRYQDKRTHFWMVAQARKKRTEDEK